MNRLSSVIILICVTLAGALVPSIGRAQIMLSGNENKIDLTGGGQRIIPNAPPDNLTILDFSQFPPKTFTIDDVPNTVIGPPSNIAISPDGRVALMANSIKIDPADKTKYVPESYVHVIDLTGRPPKVTGRVKTDLEPSGISITPNGKMALVANRASGTISVLEIDGTSVRAVESVKVGEAADDISDVAISPDGKLGLASAHKSGFLVVLEIDKSVKPTGRKISAFGQPYRVVITPDGELALTAGTGFGNALDVDALTVIDLKAPQMKTVDYVPLGVSPESIEISPDGRLLAAVVIEGSNQPIGSPNHGSTGALIIHERKDRTFVKSQRIPVGRIPEGVAFTPDGKYLAVQCHPDRQIWLFEIKNGKVTDSGQRVSVPGMPSSLRAGPSVH